MGNTLSNLVQTKVRPGLYQQYIAGAKSSWMEANARGVEYKGGKYVLMHELEVQGLGDYDRNLGFPRGNITGSKKQYELEQDRGREFLIDAADNDETGFLVNAASVMAEFQRAHVIPEIDCYRYSQIYELMSTGNYAANVKDDAISKAKITQMLCEDIAAVRDEMGMDVPLTITMSGLTQQLLGREFIHNLDYAEFTAGALHTKVRAVDGDPIIVVPSARLKTAYDFYDGVTSGQEAGGFKAASSAKDIKWLITPVTAPIAIAKIDNMRAFDPTEYQQAHAWKVDYRVFHDLWMLPDGQRCTVIRTGDFTE